MPPRRFHADGGSRSLPHRSSGDGRPRRPHQHRRPPLSKSEILSEAGRLAAEYLVSKGLLPADSLREKPLPRRPMPPPDDRRRSKRAYDNDFSDIADFVPPDHGRSRRRYDGDDEFDRFRKHGGGKREMEYRDRRRNGPDWRDWGRPRAKDRRWESRSRGDDDSAPGFRKRWRQRLREAESSGSRGAGADEVQSRSDATGYSRSETNYRGVNLEAGEEVRSRIADRALMPGGVEGVLVESERWESRSRGDDDFAPGFRKRWRERLREIESSGSRGAGADEVQSRSDATDDSRSETNYRGLNLEAGEEVRSGIADRALMPGGVEGVLVESERGREVLNLSCCLAKVPKKLRSSLAQKSSKTDQDFNCGAGKAIEAFSARESKNLVNVSCDSHEDKRETVKRQTFDAFNVHSTQQVEKSLNSRLESHRSPWGFETSGLVVDERMGGSSQLHVEKREELKNEVESTTLRVSQGNEHIQMLNSKATKSDEGFKVDVDCEPDSVVKMDAENQQKPLLFKTLDLNLDFIPEITEIAHAPVSKEQPSFLAAGNDSIDLGLSTCGASNANYGRQHSRDKKMVTVIDLEDDSLACIVSSSSKPKSEVIPSSPEDVMTHTPETNDAPTVQDGYSLEITQLLGGNISRCPSVQADISNMQDEMSLYNAEGFSGEDDPIYVSLGEFPMGLMDVWGQPPQDYGKLF